MTDPEPTWLASLPAAKAVVLREDIPLTGPLGRRELAEMLGLVAPGGREVLPDDVRNYDVESAQPVKVSPHRAAVTEPPARPEECTTPAGLRNLAPIHETAAPGRTKAPAKPRKRGPRPSRALPEGQRKPARIAACGTVSGGRRHTRLNEPWCDACREARNTYDRQRHARKKAAAGPQRSRVQCGTFGGYSKHKRDGQDPCDPCRHAMRAYFRDRYAIKTGRQPQSEKTAEYQRLTAAGVNPQTASLLSEATGEAERQTA